MKQSNKNNEYEIAIVGCDNSTLFSMQIEPDELCFFKKFCEKTVQVSKCKCEPIVKFRLTVDKTAEDDGWWCSRPKGRNRQ